MKIYKSTTKPTFPELRGNLKLLRYPCFCEWKKDGEATLIGVNLTFPNPNVHTCNKYGTCRTDWSKLDVIEDLCDDNDVESALFLAELHYGKGEAGDLYKLLSNKDDPNLLNLSVFDFSHINYKGGTKIHGNQLPLLDRREILAEIFPNEWLIQAHVCHDEAEAMQYFTQATKGGYEGVVLKNFDSKLIMGPCTWVKLKYKDQTEYTVINISTTQERIEIAVPVPGHLPGQEQWIPCGLKVTNKFKKDIKSGDKVLVEHQGVLESGSLRHPVFIKKIREEEGE
jgi:hypothetical protein